ncbi:MAG: hypothetical protein CMD46_02900 [Gammaproteobacteria bacterium]|nr:hypothetical protein [Gammaproteobacteria bacterium]
MTSKYTKNLTDILAMLWSIEKDLNLINYKENEKKIYYTIACIISQTGSCNITDVINESGYSRSTVYKTIKKFESANLIVLKQSNIDKREFNLILAT